MGETKLRLPLVMTLVIDRYLATHEQPLAISYPDGCWEFTAGDLAFACNGHREPKEGGPADGMRGPVPPFTLAVFRNGWLLGFVDPHGGTMITGTEDEVIAALQAEHVAAAEPEAPR